MARNLRVAMAQAAVGPEREENIGRALRMMTDAAGCSFAVDPYGQVVGRAPEDELALSLVDLDLVEQARRDLPFLRDRRPEMYGRLVEQIRD